MLAPDANKLEHGELRKGVTFTGYFDDQGRNDGKRERNFDDKARSVARTRLHTDGAADLLDIAAHDVHPDAAAGNAGDLRGSRKTRGEDEIVDLGLRFRRYL